MPLGIGHQLTGYDIAWLYQPYLTFMAALLALGLYAVLGRTIPSPPLRAVASFIAAQPAILVGYALWGGIKELAGAWLLAAIAALVPWTLGARRSALAAIPLAAVCAALVCVLSLPGGLWLLPALVAAASLALRPERALLERARRLRGGARRARDPGLRRVRELPRRGEQLQQGHRARQPDPAA